MLTKKEFETLTPDRKADYLSIPFGFLLFIIAGIGITIRLGISSAISLIILSYLLIRIGIYRCYYQTHATSVNRRFGLVSLIHEARTGKSFPKQLKTKYKIKECSASTIIEKGPQIIIWGILMILIGLFFFYLAIRVLNTYPLFSIIGNN